MEGLAAAKKSCDSSAMPNIAIDAPSIFVMVVPGPSLSGNGNPFVRYTGTLTVKSAVKLVPIPPAAGPLIWIAVLVGLCSPPTFSVLATCSMIKIFPVGIEMESPGLKYPIHGTGAADAGW
jgi:hypothetical protein